MKSTSGAMLAHIAAGTTKLATIWKATWTNGTVLGFTNHDSNLTVASVVYEALTGYTRSAIQSSADLSVENLELQGFLDPVRVKKEDIIAGRWDYAQIEISLVNWADPTMTVIKLVKGRLGQVSTGRQAFTAELRGLAQNMQQTIGRLYGPQCNADLFDARCAAPNEASFTVTAVPVTSVTNNRVFAATSLGNPDGWFNDGLLTFTNGPNNLLRKEVKQYLLSGGSIQLHEGFPYTVAVGNQFTIRAGCDKSVATCLSKYSNVLNFRGFPYVGGFDNMVSG